MNLRVAAIDFEFFDAGGFLQLADIKCFHHNDYNYTQQQIALSSLKLDHVEIDREEGSLR